jgi:DNA-binding transcriptional MocR family regulator
VSLGRWLPNRTVLVRSFSKSHGPDLRLAAVGGARGPVDRAVSRRILGPGWSSRILQSVLVELLNDRHANDAVAAARTAYADRRARLCQALSARGVRFTGTDGFNLWVEVGAERAAQITLAASGVRAAPGSPFQVSPLGAEHIRITISRVTDGVEQLADLLALAARGLDGRPSLRR